MAKNDKMVIDREASARLQISVRDLIQSGRINRVVLPSDHRKILDMYCRQGATQMDIATCLGISQIAVSRKLKSAYRRVLTTYPVKGVRDLLVGVLRNTRSPLITEEELRRAEV